uniref:Insulin-like domain-containing protein n=1 Tax=Chelonoidis abingdonii TaxID=106734 RepID=A0A8C0G4G0_CHEAB
MGAILGLVLISLLIAVSDVKGEGNYMKLCGRDFVRAVVFTCGGSRWRRHLTDNPQDLFGKCWLDTHGYMQRKRFG